MSWKNVWFLVLLVFGLSLATIGFTQNQSFVATLWPSNAIVLAAALRSSRTYTNYVRVFAGAAAAIFLANIAGGNRAVFSAGLTAANITEVAVATALLFMLQADITLTRMRSLCIFVMVAGVLAPLVGASIGAAVATHAHGTAWWPTWGSWFASDALGMVILGPFLLMLDSANWRSVHVGNRYAEAVAVFLLIMAVALLAGYYRAVLFVVVPVILIAVFRFGIAGAAVAIFVVALIGTAFIAMGIGAPVISQASPAERIYALQIFLAATVLWSFPVAAVLAERHRLLAELGGAKARLEADNARKSQMVVGLHHRLAHVEEKERLRLSHELHDQTGQMLAAALL